MAVESQTSRKSVHSKDQRRSSHRVQKKYLGRTGSGWMQVVSFFSIYYVCLGSFFLGMLSIYFSTEDRFGPKYQTENGFLATPGMNFRPRDKEGALIYFTKDSTTYKKYVHSLQNIIDEYRQAEDTFLESNNSVSHWKECSADTHADSSRGCMVFGTNLTSPECHEQNDFGFKDAKPCILLRLNKVYGWKPVPYKSDDELDSSMSQNLARKIKNWDSSNKVGALIWVECYGRTSVDKEILKLGTQYFPQEGWPVFNFPYVNQFKYLQPAIWVKFNSLEPFVGVFVICRAWAKNISPNVHDSAGSVSFEILYET